MARKGAWVSNVKGSAISSRVLWVSLHHGEEGLQALKRELVPMTRQIVDSFVEKSNWYPFESFVDLNEKIDRLFGKGDLSLVRELGRFGADANLTTIYRLFLMLGTVKWVLDRAPRLWALHYDSGRLVIARRPGNEAHLHVAGFNTPHPAHCLSVMGWVERSVELSGGNDVEISEDTCRTKGGDECIFSLSWQ